MGDQEITDELIAKVARIVCYGVTYTLKYYDIDGNLLFTVNGYTSNDSRLMSNVLNVPSILVKDNFYHETDPNALMANYFGRVDKWVKTGIKDPHPYGSYYDL